MRIPVWLRRGAAVCALGALIIMAGAACDSDGDGEASEEEIAAVEEVITQVLDSGAENSDYFFAHVTDNFIETVLFSTREECEANAGECIGEPAPPLSMTDTTIDGETATSTVELDFGTVEMGLIMEEDVWMVDSLEATSDEVPEGAESVDMGLVEFGFDFDADSIPADGNFAFKVSNDGEQAHEVAIAAIPAEGTLEEAMATLPEQPPTVAFKIFIVPGQEVDLAFEETPLPAGRYALVCFFPDTSSEEMTPHSELGMVGEFTVGEGGSDATTSEADATEEDSATP